MTTEDKLLGKQVEYPQHYCPAILVAVPRRQNREIYGIDHQTIYFVVMTAGMPTKPVLSWIMVYR